MTTFVKGRLKFSCKSTTAANADLTESLLDNWLKNNHFTVDKIYYPRSLFVFFLRIFFSTTENRHKNSILWQLAKIRLVWISQSNGTIGRPLGFVIDKLNTSALLYRIALCLKPDLGIQVNDHQLDQSVAKGDPGMCHFSIGQRVIAWNYSTLDTPSG